MCINRKWLWTAFGIVLAMSPLVTQAKVTDFTVTNTIRPVFDGTRFGDVGTYERIDAIAELAIDPNSTRGKKIVDLEYAPVGKDGLVHYSTKVSILRPIDAEKANGTVLYEVLNRGRNLSLALLNRASSLGMPETAQDAGDGFLMDNGYTLVWSGWQTDLPENKLKLNVPVLPSVTGLSREEFIFDKADQVMTANLTYPAMDMDSKSATLTVRQSADDPRSTVSGLSFKYLSPTQIEITRPEGFDNGAIYEFIYRAKNAVPAGLAFAATADVVSFLRGYKGHDVVSPLKNIDNSIALGLSQSGRFLRDFIYQGFNADESSTKVFDGVITHIAGSRKTYTNYRFAKVGRYSRQHEDHDVQGDQFPFSYASLTDPLTGRTDGILKACRISNTCPKIMQTDTSTEFWQARAALMSTAPDGSEINIPDEVRWYFLAGAPHFNVWGAVSKIDEVCQYPTNPISAAPVMRALTSAMQSWTTNGTKPPASQYPNTRDGSLVALSELHLPNISNDSVMPVYNVLKVMDHSVIPPIAGEAYPVFVPQLDADGIATGGIKVPRVAAPLGTYWGWNLRNEGYAKGNLCGLKGSFIAFAKDKGEIEGDTRSSISERYGDVEGYVKVVKAKVKSLVDDGFMLPGDMDFVVQQAKKDFENL